MKTPRSLRPARALAVSAAAATLLGTAGCLGGLLPATETATNIATRPELGQGNAAIREGLVLQQLATIKSSEEFLLAKEGKYGTIEQLMSAGMMNQRPDVGGYRYDLTVGAGGSSYSVTATPTTYGPDGKRSFYLDQSGTVRGADRAGAPATAGDPAV